MRKKFEIILRTWSFKKKNLANWQNLKLLREILAQQWNWHSKQ
jgi:hypothetical protein